MGPTTEPLTGEAELSMEHLDATEFDTIMFVFRVLFGLTFAGHGYAKFFKGGRISGTAGWFESMGMKPGRFHALMAAGTELGAGLLLALGFLTPFAAAGMIGVMIVAGWTVHRNNGFFIVSEGWEYTFVVGLIALAIAGLGPGGFSLDNAIGLDHLNGWAGLAIAGVLGIGAGVGEVALFYRPPVAATEGA